MPHAHAHHAHGRHRQKDERLQQSRDLPHRLDAANIDVGDDSDHGNCDHVMFPSRDPRKEKTDVVSEQHCVGTAQQERRAPVPPARQESPEVAESRARPTVETSLHRHCGRQLSGHERNRNAPEEREDEMVDERHPRPRGRDLIFQPERPRRGVRIHHEDEREQASLASSLLLLRPLLLSVGHSFCRSVRATAYLLGR